MGECLPAIAEAHSLKRIERPIRGLQGESVISVPTYPATPAATVVLDGDRPYQLTVDAEGKEQRIELQIPPKPEPK